MGDQVGVAVSSTLYYKPYRKFERIRSLAGVVPACGNNTEVLQAKKLDGEAIAAAILKEVSR